MEKSLLCAQIDFISSGKTQRRIFARQRLWSHTPPVHRLPFYSLPSLPALLPACLPLPSSLTSHTEVSGDPSLPHFLWQTRSGAPRRVKSRACSVDSDTAPFFSIYFLGIRLFPRTFSKEFTKSLVNDTLLNGLFLVRHRSDECLQAPRWCRAVVN